METTDFQFAGRLEKVFADVWELVLYAGGGAQSMDRERDADLTNGGYNKYAADGSGTLFAGTIYLSHRADLSDAPELLYFGDNYRWDDVASHAIGASSLAVGDGGFLLLNPIKAPTASATSTRFGTKTLNVARGGGYGF